MTDNISAFEHIAPFLTQPLVLVGFVLMLVFSIHKQLLKAGIIPKLDKQQGGRIVELLLRYGFLLGLVMMLLGFGWKVYQCSAFAQPPLPTTEQFHALLTGCAMGAKIDVSADMIGSITGIYNGKKSQGRATIQSESTFLGSIPEQDRLKAYELYTKCIKDIISPRNLCE